MTKLNDQYYIDLILEGNTNAFEVLVNRYKDFVFTLSIKMLKNKEEAEEVSQDTFIKAYKSLSKFKGESKFSTWLYKINYNNCLDRIKSFKSEQNFIQIENYTGNQISTLDTIFETFEAEEKSLIIQRCMNLLPEEDSFLLTLFYFEEQSIEEIAKIMSISANNVKVKLFRSRKKLTTFLKEQLEPEIIETYERRR